MTAVQKLMEEIKQSNEQARLHSAKAKEGCKTVDDRIAYIQNYFTKQGVGVK